MMNQRKKYRFGKALKAFCVLLAVLLGLLGAATGEDMEDPAPVDDPIAGEAIIDETPAEPEPMPEEPLPDLPSDSDPAPAGETSPEKAEPVAEDPLPGLPSDSDPAPEEGPGEEKKDPEEMVRWDGTLAVGTVCEVSLSESRLYRLTLDRRTDLLLEADGAAVKITITALESGLTRAWQSGAAGQNGLFAVREALALEKGAYSVAVESLREDRQGLVSLCFSVPVTEAPEAEPQPDTASEEAPAVETVPGCASEEAPAEVGSLEAELPAALAFMAESAEADAAAEEIAEAVDVTMESVEASEAGAPLEEIPEEPGDPDPAASAAEPLTVHVLVSCEEGFRPGARIVLTAVVSDPDYQGTIRWQYSADGGVTICSVEGAEGAEFDFLLDEVNCTYWWRAYLE